MKHTTGAWIAEQVGDTGGENPADVYEVNNGFTRICEYATEADARLIAAAPDLLEALQNLMSLASPHFSDATQMLALAEARAAISKATEAT